MSKDNMGNYIVSELKWDTDFFGISCAKAELTGDLSESEWSNLLESVFGYRFISLLNRDSSPANARYVGINTKAFLADVNVQFEKETKCEGLIRPCVRVTNNLEWNEDILKMASFNYSKFVVDPEFRKRSGEEVYRMWVRNSFGRADKHFVVSEDNDGKVNGFLLFSLLGDVCRIELVAVSVSSAGKGVGTSMLKACESAACKSGCGKIRVGTQLRNIGAINFYRKYGFKITAFHQTYHLWNQE